MVIYAASQIQIRRMPQLAEAVDPEDDWTGVTDAAARRKRQNRLNVRAYRRRKALEQQNHAMLTSSSGATPIIPFWDETQQTVLHLPASTTKFLPTTKTPLLPLTPTSPTTSRVIFPLSSDHLITLLQFNVLRGSILNRHLLSTLLTSSLPSSPSTPSCSSDTLNVLPYPSPSSINSLPPSLHPTTLQQTIPHEEWIDIIPHPTLRDNFITAIGKFDEDDLWSDVIGGLFEGFPDEEVRERGIMLWETPWDMNGWELSEGFVRKWGWALKGCDGEILEATNRYRVLRGEERLVVEV